MTGKQLELFEETEKKQTKKGRKEIVEDYEAFLQKFEVKRTTDDCFTPANVYHAVLDYVETIYNLDGLEIVRPFYPGGDFEAFEYSDNAIVIDNPPFSILARVCRFYLERGIRFFLFAPHLTLITSDLDVTAIICGGDIVYDNGAAVKTSFLTNLIEDLRVLATPELYAKFKRIREEGSVPLPKYEYPDNILTVSMVQKWVERGIGFKLSKKDCRHIRSLESQRPLKKGIFGSGLILSDKAAADKAAADKDNVIVWGLSEKEKKIIESLEDLC